MLILIHLFKIFFYLQKFTFYSIDNGKRKNKCHFRLEKTFAELNMKLNHTLVGSIFDISLLLTLKKSQMF